MRCLWCHADVIGPAVAVFLLLAALDHFATATLARRTYGNDLGRGINRFR